MRAKEAAASSENLMSEQTSRSLLHLCAEALLLYNRESKPFRIASSVNLTAFLYPIPARSSARIILWIVFMVALLFFLFFGLLCLIRNDYLTRVVRKSVFLLTQKCFIYCKAAAPSLRRSQIILQYAAPSRMPQL